MRYLLIILLFYVSISSFALEIPKGGKYDRRVKSIDYNSTQVVKIVGHYGFSTHIQFASYETIANIAMGDTKAWDVAPIDNHLFIKPIDDEAETNMTIITNRRVYNFELTAHKSKKGAHPYPNDMFFQVDFNYPDDELKIKKAELEAKELEKKLNTPKTNNPNNWNYWAKGSTQLTPSRMYDNGQFTYITFKDNQVIPAIYQVDEQGEESLVNNNINPTEPTTVIIHKVGKRFIFRNGNDVICIFNEGFNKYKYKAENTGTTSPEVKRIIKGNE